MDEPRLVEAFVELARVMARLRRECPWDRRQTHESLRRYLVEECHEVLEALDAADSRALRKELGDLLFQIWFHAEVASERPEDQGGFDLADVAAAVADKLVRRHPHVFGDSTEQDIGRLKQAWEKRKLEEGRRSRLEGIPALSPALLAAQLMQEKAAAAGFDWPDVQGVLEKVREEVAELEAELPPAGISGAEAGPASAGQIHELGDLFFSLVNLSRRLGIVAEDALRLANARFRRRFEQVEAGAAERGRDLTEMTLEEMERLWVLAKRREA